jgi:type II secretory pathway component PulJ
MTRRLRSQRGTTLIEMVLASALMLIVTGASLTAFDALQDSHKFTTEHNDAQDIARQHTDRFARELRNLASPSDFTNALAAQPQAVDRADPFDLVFRVVDDVRPGGSLNTANVKRVRYCLSNGDPSRAVLYRQQQTWTNGATAPAVPPAGSCPGAGWNAGQDKQVVPSVVNRINGQDRPVFLVNSNDLQRITKVRTDLFVDPTPTRRPVETRLSSGVFLRNQNRVPTAAFTVSPSGNRVVVLNGSSSDDPEGMPLTYTWYRNPPSPLPNCKLTPTPASCIGEGVVLTHTVPTGNIDYTFKLVVRDPAELAAEAEQEVHVP